MRRGIALLPVGLALLSIAEIVVFLSVAHAIGGGWAILLLLAFSVTGLALLRREGIRGWRRFQAAAVTRDMPEEAARVLRELGYKIDSPEPRPNDKQTTLHNW